MISPIPKLQRIKDEDYLKFVRSLSCVITGYQGDCIHPHHLIGHNQGGMGTKSSDYYAFPLRSDIHQELHNQGWRAFEEKYGSQWQFAAETQAKWMEINNEK